MGFQLVKSLNLNLRHFWTTPFQYALLVTAAMAPKLMHLWSHKTSLPPVLTIVYLPTFMGLDAINAILFWILVHIGQVRTPIWLKVFRSLISLIILGASAMQIAFYLETGGEIKWGASGNFVHDLAGIKVLLSGSMQAAITSIVIIVVARMISVPLYNFTDRVVRTLMKASTGREMKSRAVWTQESGPGYLQVATADEENLTDYTSSQGDDQEASGPRNEKKQDVRWYSVWITRLACFAPFIITIILCVLRPTTFPYAHMSGSLPYTLAEIWIPVSNLCFVTHSGDYTSFPLPELLTSSSWELPNGKFPGWMPNENVSSLASATTPPWLPKVQMDGFERWYNHENHDKDLEKRRGRYGSSKMVKDMFRYDPAQDPLRITNLDQEVLRPISNALKDHKIAIKHIVLLTMESTRGDIFPLKKGSFSYENIINSHGSDKESAIKAERELSQLTVNAELLTGQNGGFDRDNNKTYSIAGSWRDLKEDRGGINILGSMTGSTTSFKSVVGAHCGVGPLPVDFTVEAQRKIYQPCVPQILNLFNHNKPKDSERSQGVNSMPWKSVFVQSITDQFDKQDVLNRHMGWSDIVVKDTLLESSAKYPPTEKESNYFGFPEPQIKPYLHDLFYSAEKNRERVFLSHMTSSTHHPWNTPEGTETVDFLKRDNFGAESHFNRYLNTVKYADRWIGEVMDMLQDIGVAEETLVVMVGDHGWAFTEDTPEHSTFENGHVTNLRVPLVFHHSSLPRIQLAINATSISIIPTVLDLLVITSSLSPQDVDIASNLIHQYEGQSLIRPYQTTKAGRRAWNIAVLNAGGAVLSVSSAAVPFRLIIPVCTTGVYRFTDISRDPYELAPMQEFSIEKLAKKIRKNYNDDVASKWLADADKVGRYWVTEQRRRWRYNGGGTAREMDPGEMSGMGQIKKAHWWDT